MNAAKKKKFGLGEYEEFWKSPSFLAPISYPTLFDRSVSSYVGLSALWGLTDFLWSGGMCES